MKFDVYYTAYQKRLLLGNLIDREDRIVFEYDEGFACDEINVMPIRSVMEQPQISSDMPPALFWDMLPSGFNGTLLNKVSKKTNDQISVFKKLGLCSKRTVGALEIEPSLPIKLEEKEIDLDEIESNIRNETNLRKIYCLASSINGHTPKIVASVSEDKKHIFEEKNDSSYAEWIIKLPSLTENPKDGFVEWVYSQMAQKAGIEVPEYALFDSKNCAGFFGSKRFDRNGKNKIHTLSIGAVTGKYYLRESLSIRDHFDTVSRVAPQDLPALLKLLIFNRKTGNDDMRGTNISLILKDDKVWKLAPAYDLVPFSLHGLCTPKMLQKGYDKNEEDGLIYDLCESLGVDLSEVAPIIEKTESAISECFGKYERLISNGL